MKRSAIFRLMLILGAMILLPVIPAQSQTVVSSASNIAWSPDGSQLAVSGDFGIAIYKSDFQLETILTTQFTRALAWSPNGDLLASSSNNSPGESYMVSLWDMSERKLFANIPIPISRTFVWKILWSPDSERLAIITGEEGISIYEVSTQIILYYLTESPQYIQAADWSPDGRYIVAGGGGEYVGTGDTPVTLTIWQANTGDVEFFVDLTTEGFSRISKLAWSPDGTTIAIGSPLSPKGSIPFLDITSKTIEYGYLEPIEPIRFLSWDTDGVRLAAADAGGSESILFIWNNLTGERLLFQPQVSFDVSYVGGAWRPSENQLAMLVQDDEKQQTSVHILDATTGNEIAVPELPPVTPTIILEGTLWNDINQNGLYESQETPLGEIELQLLDSRGAVVQTTSTLANGHYRFETAPGTYTVEISTSDYTLSPANQGSDDTLDSDFDPVTNRTEPITLTASESIRLDAGMVAP